MSLHFRPATPADTAAAVPLIHSAGPEAFEYGYSYAGRSARDFLAHTFADGSGLFGCNIHTVAELDGRVVGIGSFYSGQEYGALTQRLLLQMLRFYPLTAMPQLVKRSLQLGKMSPAPSRRTHFVANFGVRPELRSQGIGAALLHHQRQVGRQLGRIKFALDVSVANPRGQALYERLGMMVVREQRFPGPAGAVPDARRMEMSLAPGDIP
ncbi:MAG TPA: GNAT family N-acetyltransferase [Solimonas sp.]|nr:GNAT family N-acetyltransferase [Solimonas sp.]